MKQILDKDRNMYNINIPNINLDSILTFFK